MFKSEWYVGAALLLAADASPFGLIANKVNEMNTSWTAQVPAGIIDLAHARRLCGTFLKGHPDYQALPEIDDLKPLSNAVLPTTFSWREQRPDCPSIRLVRDQSSCGSCWAFSATECFNDRRCIHRNDTRIYSPEDTVSCCSGLFCGLSQGCNGGQPGAALHWMARTGIVTGGSFEDIGTGKTCRPYTMAPCAHHVPPSAKYPACPADYHTPKCTKECSETKYPTKYAEDKTKGLKAYSVSGVNRIMTDLYQNGPLSVALTVYEDFLTYKSGVYVHVHGSALGGHAVELVGWGTENGLAYWLIKNSWNEQWGLNGYVKIRRGVDECGIESNVNGITV